MELRRCDVCYYVDTDDSLKMCIYCPSCDSWICEQDKMAWGRRARAALSKWQEKNKGQENS